MPASRSAGPRRSSSASRWAGAPGRCSSRSASASTSPGIAAMPPLDRDEARFMQATRQMLETGDFIRIRFQDEARNKKPAGIYWLQAASVEPPQHAREQRHLALPPALAARRERRRAAELRLRRTARRSRQQRCSARCCWRAASSSSSEAHLAKTDATLLATVVAAQGALGEIYRRSRAGDRRLVGHGARLLAGAGLRHSAEGPGHAAW